MIYAGFFRRLIAFLLDICIVLVPTILFLIGPMVVFTFLTVGGLPNPPSPDQLNLLGIAAFGWQILLILFLWLYFALLESGPHQATWGKRLLGIKVIGQDGARISFARATGRFFSKILSYATFYIGFIMAAFTNRKCALHDMICETYVVKKEVCPGQELPPTPRHIGWLIIVCIGWLLLLMGLIMLSLRLSMTPTQLAAQEAAIQMNQLAQSATRLNEPLRTKNATFFFTPEGYRAVVTDPDSGNKFTLLLPHGANQACCLTFPFSDCENTGLTGC